MNPWPSYAIGRVRVLAACVALLLAACAASDHVADRQYGQSLVCHEGRTLSVSNADMFVHQGHGDALGPCPEDG